MAAFAVPFNKKLLVGVRGFEPPAPSSRTRCATRLRYTPPRRRTISPAAPCCTVLITSPGRACKPRLTPIENGVYLLNVTMPFNVLSQARFWRNEANSKNPLKVGCKHRRFRWGAQVLNCRDGEREHTCNIFPLNSPTPTLNFVVCSRSKRGGKGSDSADNS
jgi:hypothetical protein